MRFEIEFRKLASQYNNLLLALASNNSPREEYYRNNFLSICGNISSDKLLKKLKNDINVITALLIEYDNAKKQILSTFTDPRDGKAYRTVKIGEQIWLAENLAFNCAGSKCYDNNPDNSEKYGRLYDWETAKKACPPGWHLPSDKEWQKLVDFVGGEEVAGKKLKAKTGWNENGNGTDEYGFAALPCGYGDADNYFYDLNFYGNWLSMSEEDAYNAFYLYMSSYDDCACWFYYKSYFYSIRCVKD
jgi:uncharacterized protein (TIGR02145 family)